MTFALAVTRPMGTVVQKSTCSAAGGTAPLSVALVNTVVVDEIKLVGSRCGPFDVAMKMLEQPAIQALLEACAQPLPLHFLCGAATAPCEAMLLIRTNLIPSPTHYPPPPPPQQKTQKNATAQKRQYHEKVLIADVFADADSGWCLQGLQDSVYSLDHGTQALARARTKGVLKVVIDMERCGLLACTVCVMPCLHHCSTMGQKGHADGVLCRPGSD